MYVSFAMTIGATSPAWTVLMSKLILKKDFHYLVYVSIVPMVVGIVMGTKGEMNFDMIGFICCTFVNIKIRQTKTYIISNFTVLGCDFPSYQICAAAVVAD